MAEEQAEQAIASRSQPSCYLCGSPGRLLHADLEDRLFGVPGAWTLKQCADPSCALAWLDPMPLEEEIHKAYRNYHTHTYESPRPTVLRRIYWAARDGYLRRTLGYTQGVGPAWYRFLSPIARLHPGGWGWLQSGAMYLPAPQPGARLLDVGCGSGDLMARMQQLGWQVEGQDVDPAAVQAARSRGLNVHEGDLEALNLPDASFDATHLSHVVEHVHDPLRLLRDCRRLLRPGGTIEVLTPNLKSWGHDRFGQDWRGLEPPRHLYVFGPQNLRRLVEGAGFRVDSIRTLARGVRIIWSGSASIRRSRASENEPGRAARLLERVTGLRHQIAERALLRRRPDAGEEILLLGSKT